MSNYTPTGAPIAQSRGASSSVRSEFSAIATAINSKLDTTATTGQVWTGLQDFSGATEVRVPTPTAISHAVTKAYADAITTYAQGLAFQAALPAQAGNAGKFVTTNGTTASWIAAALPVAAAAADVKVGTDTAKMVTPAAVLGALGFSAYMQTADQVITSGGALTIAHGLARAPIAVFAFLKNITAEFGYVAGDITPTLISGGIATSSGNGAPGVAITFDATNIYVRYGAAYVFPISNKTTGVGTVITAANWSFFIRVLA